MDQTKNKYRILSIILLFIGITEIMTGIIIHPIISQYWRNNIINYQDVMKIYFYTSLVIGILTLFLSISIRYFKIEILLNISLTFLLISIFILSDRLLLAKYGLPIWKYDKEIHYRHRENIIRTWGEKYQNKLIYINKYGFHDYNFDEKKNNDEFRAVSIGNSITMGHGVTYAETYSYQLEQLLRDSIKQFHKFKVINTGVQGYSTFQYLELFKESLRFSPSFVTIGFCLNDVLEPTRVNKKFGGTGFDYHRIVQAGDDISAYLLNETGYGMLIQKIKFKNMSSNTKEQELTDVMSLCKNSDQDIKIKNWYNVLSNLDDIYTIAKNNHIKPLLLIFPYTFQLFNDSLKTPQNIN